MDNYKVMTGIISSDYRRKKRGRLSQDEGGWVCGHTGDNYKDRTGSMSAFFRMRKRSSQESSRSSTGVNGSVSEEEEEFLRGAG